MNEKKIKEYDQVFDFITIHHPDWERLLVNDDVKIKTNQKQVQFIFIEQILHKFNLKITDVYFTEYYGIVFGIEKLKSI